jgi:hypothetical protein
MLWNCAFNAFDSKNVIRQLLFVILIQTMVGARLKSSVNTMSLHLGLGLDLIPIALIA